MLKLTAHGRTFTILLDYENNNGSDPYNLGKFNTPEELRERHPTALFGNYAIVGSTDTFWLWDNEGNEWVDTDKGYDQRKLETSYNEPNNMNKGDVWIHSMEEI